MSYIIVYAAFWLVQIPGIYFADSTVTNMFPVLTNIIDGDMTKPFVIILPREEDEPDQVEFPWNCEELHELMPIVDEISTRLDIEHEVMIMPADNIKIGFPSIPDGDFLELLDYITEHSNMDWAIDCWTYNVNN